RGPEAHHGSERRNEKLQESAGILKLAGGAQHGSEAASLVGDPPQHQQSHAQHKGCADSLQELDRVYAFPNDKDIEQPKSSEAKPDHAGVGRGWPENLKHGMDGLTADPGLDSEP